MARELTARELTAGELTAGELTAGELTAGELTADELTARELTAGELTAHGGVSAVVLAGGRATRMGGADKGLIEFQGELLAARICAALEPQVAEVLINANRNLKQYRRLGYKVVEDKLADYQGPLAGMHAALPEAAHPWLLTVPCDGPFVAEHYAATMRDAASAKKVSLAVAHDGARMQPVYALIHRRLAVSLEQFLAGGGRKIDRWYAQHAFATVDFSAVPSMFVNVNTPRQLAEIAPPSAAQNSPPPATRYQHANRRK